MQAHLKREKLRQFKAEEGAIRAILNAWDPLPGSPEEEYDSLVHHILSLLHRGTDPSGMTAIIQNELTGYFSFDWIRPEETKSVAGKIWDWWTKGRALPRSPA